MSIGTEIIIILGLVLLNGFFAMAEIAVISANKSRLLHAAEQGNASARSALELTEEPNRFLATIQVGITLIGIFAGAFGGATVAGKLSEMLPSIPVLAPYREGIGIGLVVLLITYLSLVLGELVPKRLGLHTPERIATLIARPMQQLSNLTAPIIQILSLSTDGILKIFGIKGPAEPILTEEDVKQLIRQGARVGVFEEIEQHMAERVFRLADQTVESQMTPRTLINWLDTECSDEENIQEILNNPYSIFPVCQGELDTVIGTIHVKELYKQTLSGKPFSLTQRISPPMFVPESMPLLNVLEMFKKTGNHLALITDEYGTIQGLITLTDVMEAIVGELPSAEEIKRLDVVQRDDGSWLMDGMVSISTFKETLGITDQTLPDEEDYQTLGGFVIHQLERIPEPSDSFTWQTLRFEVMDMDGNRVDKVLVESLIEETETESDNQTL